ERGRPEIDLSDDERNEQSYECERNGETIDQIAAPLLETGKPPRQEKDYGDLANLRWLKSQRSGADPPSRAIDAHAEMRYETKRECSECNNEPNPPGVLPKMIIE